MRIPFQKRIGQRFGFLVVESVHEYIKTETSRRIFFNCLCDCGNKKVVSLQSLMSGASYSCGCMYTVKGSNAKTKSDIERDQKKWEVSYKHRRRRNKQIAERFHAMAKKSGSLIEALESARASTLGCNDDPQDK